MQLDVDTEPTFRFAHMKYINKQMERDNVKITKACTSELTAVTNYTFRDRNYYLARN